MMDSGVQKDHRQQWPSTMHRPFVTEVFSEICVSQCQGNGEPFQDGDATGTRETEEDARHTHQSGEPKVRPTQVPPWRLIFAVPRAEFSSRADIGEGG